MNSSITETVLITIDNDGAGVITGFAFLNSPTMSNRPNTDELMWGPSSNNLGGRTWNDVTGDNFWNADEPYYGSVAGAPKPGNGIQNGETGAEFSFTRSGGGSLAALVDKWASNNPTSVWSSSNPVSDMLFRVQDTDGPAGSDKIAVNLVQVPEPSTYGMIGAGVLVVLLVSRRLKRVR